MPDSSVFGVVTRFSLGRHAIFRTISKTRIHYPDSPLSQGVAGDVHRGDRLPWTGTHAQNNFEPLRSLDWQAHVYGEVDKDVETVSRQFQPAITCLRLERRQNIHHFPDRIPGELARFHLSSKRVFRPSLTMSALSNSFLNRLLHPLPRVVLFVCSLF
jgi:hypothetical protein